MDISTKLENQNYLSKILLAYLSKEFCKILKILGQIDVCKAFYFTKDYDEQNRRVRTNFLFVEIGKQSSSSRVRKKSFIENLSGKAENFLGTEESQILKLFSRKTVAQTSQL